MTWEGVDDSNLKNLNNITVSMTSTASPSETKTYKASKIFNISNPLNMNGGTLFVIDNRKKINLGK